MLGSSVYCHSQFFKLAYDSLYKSGSIDKQYGVSKYLFGGVESTYVVGRTIIEGQKISFFTDSLKYFHRNGVLKEIQIFDSLGTPQSLRKFDKLGEITEELQCIYLSEKPYHLSKNSDELLECYLRKYKKGTLTSEGLLINGKKHGLHVYYKDGMVQSRKVYNNGKLVE